MAHDLIALTILVMLCLSMGFTTKTRIFRCVAFIRPEMSSAKLFGVASTSDGGGDGTLKKWVCPSCSYIYDETKGSKPKKRYPPGTRWEEIEVFLCPVCGASKNQFTEYFEDEGIPPVPETINGP